MGFFLIPQESIGVKTVIDGTTDTEPSTGETTLVMAAVMRVHLAPKRV